MTNGKSTIIFKEKERIPGEINILIELFSEQGDNEKKFKFPDMAVIALLAIFAPIFPLISFSLFLLYVYKK